ncbi:MAG: hypothetical protein ACI4RN_05105 [Oscillospiraceae bacterium]
MTRKIFSNIYLCFCTAIIIFICIMLISRQDFISQAIISATKRCLNVIIPSLFAFIAISSILINSNLIMYLAKPFNFISKALFGFSGEIFITMLISNVSGFPIGASLLTKMLENKQISKKSAEILCCFCYGGGPAFFSGAIGLTVFNSTRIGMIIFLSCLTSNIILALILGRIYKPDFQASNPEVYLNSECVIQSVLSAGKAMFTICVTIVFFSAIIAIIESMGILGMLPEKIEPIIKGILEISNLSDISIKSRSIIPIVTAICSFGGICVLLQIKAIVKDKFSLKYFLIARTFAMIIAYGISFLLVRKFLPKEVFASAHYTKAIIDTDNIIPSVCLMCMIFIIFMGNKKMPEKSKGKIC